MLAVQGELPQIKNTATGYQKNKYAPIDEILTKVIPITHRHGLVIYHTDGHDEQGNYVEAHVRHVASGEELTSRMYYEPNTDPQKMGSAQTYFRRYTLRSVLAIRTGEDDDGGAAAGLNGHRQATQPKRNGRRADTGEAASDKQVAQIIKLADDTGTERPKIKAHYKVDDFADLTAIQAANVIEKLKAKLHQQEAQPA